VKQIVSKLKTVPGKDGGKVINKNYIKKGD